jgi:hypothetical protein
MTINDESTRAAEFKRWTEIAHIVCRLADEHDCHLPSEEAWRAYLASRALRGQGADEDAVQAVKRVMNQRGIGGCDEEDAVAITAAVLTRTLDKLCIIFDGPPSHESGRFVEVEDGAGHSIRVGEWKQRPDKLWALELTGPYTHPTPSQQGAQDAVLPHAVDLGGMVFDKGVKLSTLINAAKRWRDQLVGNTVVCGIKAHERIISDECRRNAMGPELMDTRHGIVKRDPALRSDVAAFDEALASTRRALLNLRTAHSIGNGAKIHVVVTVDAPANHAMLAAPSPKKQGA